MTPGQIQRLQYIFDTYQELPELPPLKDVVEDAAWAVDMDPQSIYQRHEAGSHSKYIAGLLVILDEQTAKDDTVMIVSPELLDEEEVHMQMRCTPEKVPLIGDRQYGNGRGELLVTGY